MNDYDQVVKASGDFTMTVENKMPLLSQGERCMYINDGWWMVFALWVQVMDFDLIDEAMLPTVWNILHNDGCLLWSSADNQRYLDRQGTQVRGLLDNDP